MANYSEPIFNPIHKERDLVIKRQSTAIIFNIKNQSSTIIHPPKNISSNRGNPFLNSNASTDTR